MTTENSRDQLSPASTMSDASENLLRYHEFIVTQSEYRQRRLELLSKRDKSLTFAFYLTSAAALLAGIAGVILLVNRNQYGVVTPFGAACLAALATSFKQLQLQTYKRTRSIVRDIRNDVLVRGAAAALLQSKRTGIDQDAVRRLVAALMALKADEVADKITAERSLLPADRAEIQHRTADSWDPISVFLGTG